MKQNSLVGAPQQALLLLLLLSGRFAEEAARELGNEHTGRACLVVLLSVYFQNIATKRPGRDVNASCQEKSSDLG